MGPVPTFWDKLCCLMIYKVVSLFIMTYYFINVKGTVLK